MSETKPREVDWEDRKAGTLGFEFGATYRRATPSDDDHDCAVVIDLDGRETYVVLMTETKPRRAKETER